MKRSLKEAASELTRELQVRRRCFGRWVSDGKLTEVEALDRMERMEAALVCVERSAILAEIPSPPDVAPSAGPVIRAALEDFGAPPAEGEWPPGAGPIHRIRQVLLRAPQESDAHWEMRVADANKENLRAGTF